MKKVLVTFYLCLFSFRFLYSQSEADSVCISNIETIFKVFDHKIKYEMVQSVYQEKNKYGRIIRENWSRYFIIRGFFPLVSKEQKDLINSNEEWNTYIERMDCTPEQAFQEYKDLIQHIKVEKNIYLKCIDAELAKGDSSKNFLLGLYSFMPAMSSYLPPPGGIRKLDFLNVFKKFILIDNEEVLPHGLRVRDYLQSNCKILNFGIE